MIVLACHHVLVVWVDDHVAGHPYLKTNKLKEKNACAIMYHRLSSFHMVLIIIDIIEISELLERIKIRHSYSF